MTKVIMEPGRLRNSGCPAIRKNQRKIGKSYFLENIWGKNQGLWIKILEFFRKNKKKMNQNKQ